jgi:cysteinyl-tRNA synthetase
MLSTHYRADLNFNEDDLKSSKKRLDKLYRLKKRVYGLKISSQKPKIIDDILEVLNDDLNISKAFALIDEYIQKSNETLDTQGKHKNLKQELGKFFEEIEKLLGFGGNDAYRYFQYGVDDEVLKTLEELIKKRDEAKQNKDYETSDKIRQELNDMGISIMDTPNGTVWERV